MKRSICLRLLLSIAVAVAICLANPTARAAANDIYETNMQLVLRILPGGGTPITFAIGLSNPKGLVFDGTGHLYVADASLGSVIRFTTPDGTTGITFANNLASPVGVTFSAAGDLYVTEAGNGNVTKFNVADGTRAGFASGLGQPAGLVFATNGNLFVADFGGGKIYQISPDGMTKTVFASGLNLPSGLAFDISGNLFEADSGSGTIFKFAPDGTKTTFATGLSRPYGLVFESTGNLVVSDNGNGGTFRFSPSGDRSNLFSSEFNTPVFVTVEPLNHEMLNLSSRAFVSGGDHNLIAGFNIGGVGPVGIKTVIRALGPSLADSGVTDPLSDPALEIRDSSGTLISFNNNWADASDAEKVTNLTLQPRNAAEAALQLTLRGGLYTAIVSGFNNTTGTALVEVYNLH